MTCCSHWPKSNFLKFAFDSAWCESTLKHIERVPACRKVHPIIFSSASEDLLYRWLVRSQLSDWMKEPTTSYFHLQTFRINLRHTSFFQQKKSNKLSTWTVEGSFPWPLVWKGVPLENVLCSSFNLKVTINIVRLPVKGVLSAFFLVTLN